MQTARNLDGPALVAEIALDLADDRRRRVRRELDAALEIEAVDRLEQSDGADLNRDRRAPRRGSRISPQGSAPNSDARRRVRCAAVRIPCRMVGAASFSGCARRWQTGQMLRATLTVPRSASIVAYTDARLSETRFVITSCVPSRTSLVYSTLSMSARIKKTPSPSVRPLRRSALPSTALSGGPCPLSRTVHDAVAGSFAHDRDRRRRPAVLDRSSCTTRQRPV